MAYRGEFGRRLYSGGQTIGGVMKKLATALLLCLCIVSFGRAATIDIPPVGQHLQFWCWAAVSEMIFRHYSVPEVTPINYQCGIVAFRDPVCSQRCDLCNVGAGSMHTLKDVLKRYPEIARNRTGEAGPRVGATVKKAPLSAELLRDEIDEGLPVVVGISPSQFTYGGVAQHVALVVGYEEDEEGLSLIVNDPFPYDLSIYASFTNPYIRHGGTLIVPWQYRIKYEKFRKGLNWTESIYNITCTGGMCP